MQPSKLWDMSVNPKKYKLGSIIEPVRIRCGESNPEVVGVDINHSFIPTRANLSGVDTTKYQVVPESCFACNLMHIGRDERIPLAYNDTGRNLVITPAYYVFRIKKDMEALVIPYYLYLYLCRQETDRYTWFCTDSSIRGNLPESRLLDIEIPVPDIEIQRQLVAVWEGLNGLKVDNDAQAEPLMGLCMSYLKKLRGEYHHVAIGQFIRDFDERNLQGADLPVLGLNKEKVFIPTAANLEGVDLKKYKDIQKGNFVFSGMQTGRDECIRLSLYSEQSPALVSPAYTTFTIDSERIIPEFFYLLFLRKEMDRYGAFISDSSVRANLDWPRFKDIAIPVPPKSIQQAIVDIYKCAKESKAISTKAEKLRKAVAPALIQKAIHY